MNDNLIERLSDEADQCRNDGADDIANLLDEARAAIERQSVPTMPEPVPSLELSEYDAGLLNDFGGGNVEWWQDYIRAELGRAYEHYQSQIPAPQPQPVQPEGPMATTVEQAARDVAKCLNELDGQGLDLRHVAMLAHYAQQPVQEPVKGWWAHTCPEDGKVDVVNYQLTPADKRAGWVEHEVYTSPQAQPQPVQEQCPECDGTGTVAGSQAHFPCPICTSPQAQPLSDEQKQEIHNETGAGHALISLVESYITKGTT